MVNKQTPITFTEEMKETIKKAAEKKGLTFASFVRSSSLIAARKTLKEEVE